MLVSFLGRPCLRTLEAVGGGRLYSILLSFAIMPCELLCYFHAVFSSNQLRAPYPFQSINQQYTYCKSPFSLPFPSRSPIIPQPNSPNTLEIGHPHLKDNPQTMHINRSSIRAPSHLSIPIPIPHPYPSTMEFANGPR